MRRHGPALVVCCLLLAACLGPAAPGGGDATTPGAAGTTPAGTATGGTPAADTATADPSTRARVTATVVDVVDGDTVRVRFANGTRETVRLLGVDTPEVRGENAPDEFEGVPDTEAGRTCLRTYGDRASAYARERLGGREVGLGFDENEGRRGFYDRLLAYVYVDGRQFNLDLVAAGYARMYDSQFLERDRYAAAEDRARSDTRGLWACRAGTAVPTDEGTTAPDGGASLAVSVHPDAAGNDNENLNGEYVVLTNEGDESVDLSGWTVADAADHRYTFPSGTTLSPGASLTLYTGEGADGDGDYYWGRTSAVWNNGGDTVTVRARDGTVVAERTY
jgi:micrococcal nuclease